MICQKCFKSRKILEALEKLRVVDGCAQCVDCFSDLEHESVVLRDIYFKRKIEKGTPYPKWLQDELEEKGLAKIMPLRPEIEKLMDQTGSDTSATKRYFELLKRGKLSFASVSGMPFEEGLDVLEDIIEGIIEEKEQM